MAAAIIIVNDYFNDGGSDFYIIIIIYNVLEYLSPTTSPPLRCIYYIATCSDL